jgi:glycosyltransferase involved in cell wall biosynthesis
MKSALSIPQGFSIADNIAQNNLIECIAESFSGSLQIITINQGNPKAAKTGKNQYNIVLDNGIPAIGVSCISNNPVLFHLSVIVNSIPALFRLMKNVHKEKKKNLSVILISFAPYIDFTFPVWVLKTFFNVTWVLFFLGTVEKPEFTGLNRNLQKLSNKLFIKKADASITYVENTSKTYTTKPYLTILYSLSNEMISLSDSLFQRNKIKRNSPPVVLYTGALTKVAGIPILLETILQSKIGEFEWIICGSGEYENKIRQLVQERADIRFLGSISQKQVIELQHQADLLISLRALETEIDKYYGKFAASAKLIEYLLSGVPVLTTDTESINPLIHNYLNFPNDNSPSGVILAIRNILQKESYDSYKEKSMVARKFIKKTANNDSQKSMIVEFLKELVKKENHSVESRDGQL